MTEISRYEALMGRLIEMSEEYDKDLMTVMLWDMEGFPSFELTDAKTMVKTWLRENRVSEDRWHEFVDFFRI